MKKLIILFCIGLVFQANAQKVKESEVPKVVKSAFAKAYPTAKGVNWGKESDGYEASFNQGKKEMSVVMNDMGVVKEVETEISKDQLPKAVLETLKKEYADHQIEETTLIVANSISSYEVEVEKGKKSWDLIFDSSGNLLKKIEKDEEKEKG